MKTLNRIIFYGTMAALAVIMPTFSAFAQATDEEGEKAYITLLEQSSIQLKDEVAPQLEPLYEYGHSVSDPNLVIEYCTKYGLNQKDHIKSCIQKYFDDCFMADYVSMSYSYMKKYVTPSDLVELCKMKKDPSIISIMAKDSLLQQNINIDTTLWRNAGVAISQGKTPIGLQRASSSQKFQELYEQYFESSSISQIADSYVQTACNEASLKNIDSLMLQKIKDYVTENVKIALFNGAVKTYTESDMELLVKYYSSPVLQSYIKGVVSAGKDMAADSDNMLNTLFGSYWNWVKKNYYDSISTDN